MPNVNITIDVAGAEKRTVEFLWTIEGKSPDDISKLVEKDINHAFKMDEE